ncbi:MAG: TraR/DksA family transcriptional regulator [Acidimicrobiales bacterium]|jgi:RNA polymerase-binding transcription factor DksA
MTDTGMTEQKVGDRSAPGTFVPEVDRALLDRARSDLDDVDAALRRLEEASYGQCEACGAPIGDSRLAALPAARYCLRHQQVAE